MPNKTLISPAIIRHELNAYIIGQNDVKNTLSIIGFNHLLKMLNKDIEDLPTLITLITGGSGTGKTASVNALAKVLGLPFYHIDANVLEPPHNSYNDIYQHIDDYYEQYKNDKHVEHGIFFIDEFDKLFSYDNHGHHNSSYVNSVNNQFLPLFEGKIKKGKKYNLDTSKLLIILGGAFEYVYDKRATLTQSMGFKADFKTKEEQYKPLTKEDIQKYSYIIPEILGRIDVVTGTLPLTQEDYLHIMYECKGAIGIKFETMLKLSGCKEINLNAEDEEEIINKCKDSKYGARLLKSNIFETIKERLMYSAGVDMDTPDKEENSTLSSEGKMLLPAYEAAAMTKDAIQLKLSIMIDKAISEGVNHITIFESMLEPDVTYHLKEINDMGYYVDLIDDGISLPLYKITWE